MRALTESGFMPQILAIEKIMHRCESKVTELPLEHYFIDGVYVRSLFIPAGMVLTGKIHNKENISILAQGEISITNGTDVKTIKAPHIMVDKPGVKRLGYAVSDCTFINVIRTDLTDIEEIEKELVSDTFEQYENLLLSNSREAL